MQGIELLELRRKAGITQAELSKAIGYSRKAIVHWERNIHPIPVDIVPAIFHACTKEHSTAKEAKRKADSDRETLEAYSELRGFGRSHAYIVGYWAEKSFQPSLEAQAAIAAAFPDILQN